MDSTPHRDVQVTRAQDALERPQLATITDAGDLDSRFPGLLDSVLRASGPI